MRLAARRDGAAVGSQQPRSAPRAHSQAVEDWAARRRCDGRDDAPAGSAPRERVADRAEAEALIGALAGDEHDERALRACAFYGLRRGELRAVRWSDVDFAAGMIHVVRGWDDADGPITTKSLAGERRVPLAGQLRKLLIAH